MVLRFSAKKFMRKYRLNRNVQVSQECTLYKCSGMCQLYSRDNFMQICVQQFAHYIREMKNEDEKKGATKQYNKRVMEQAHLHT